MKYFKKSSKKNKLIPIIVFTTLLIIISYNYRAVISRNVINISIPNLYHDFLNTKANLMNYLNNNNLEVIEISMSPNNYVRIQKERSFMLKNYVQNNEQWNNRNSYFKAKFKNKTSSSRVEIKLFGLNPDHFRKSDGHSFRLKFDGVKSFGKRKLNFISPQTRDFITDPLVNIIFKKLYNGIGIDYNPVNIYFNKKKYGLYYSEDFFDKYLIEKNNKRESVIFEIINDTIHLNHLNPNNSTFKLGINNNNRIHFNHLDDTDNLQQKAYEIIELYNNNYNYFLEKIDEEKIKAILYLSFITNGNHHLGGINLHWYYNPVNGLIEPTIREAYTTPIKEINFSKILNENKIIFDVYNKKIKRTFYNDFAYELKKIDSLINFDNDYIGLKKQMIGYSREIKKKEVEIKKNIQYLMNEFKINNEYKKIKHNNIVINKDTILKNDFVVKHNETLIIEKGVNIYLNNSYIKIYGSVNMMGEEKDSINIIGLGKNSGTIFINSKKKNYFNYVKFKNLTNKRSDFKQPSSITIYESNNVIINNSLFIDNINGDDYVNIFRSKNIIIKNSVFKNTINDAIDSDFSDVFIENISFINIGNDAIDGSGSNIKVYENYFYNVKDKAVSAGENSNINVINSRFENNEIALCVKDESTLKSSNNTMMNNKLDFASFIKKLIYKSPKAIITNTKIENYLIENGSKIEGIKDIVYIKDVESKLYGNYYGK